jgi:S1-C subfamily serine protease
MRSLWILGAILSVSLLSAYSPPATWALVRTIQIYEHAAQAVVTLTAMQSDGPSSGAGCVVDSRGIIVTSRHVITNASSITATFQDGRIYTAKIVANNVGLSKDLAILKLQPKHANERFEALAMADSESVRVGQRVLAIGNPYGFERTLTLGIVSRMDRQHERIQTDASINPGNSGGPLLNTDGQIIGINQSIFNPEGQKTNIGIGFAIPINVVKPQLMASIGEALAEVPSPASQPSTPRTRMLPVNLRSRLRSDASFDPSFSPSGASDVLEPPGVRLAVQAVPLAPLPPSVK